MFSATDYDKLQQIMEEAPWKKELLTRLLESHRMEVSAISHEIRNPFTLIYSTLQMIESERPDVTACTHWQTLCRDMEYMKLLLEELSSYNNGDHLNLAPMDTNTFLKTLALSFASSLVDTDIEFRSEISPELPPVTIDGVKLRQVLLNLLRNAKDAVTSFPYPEERLPSIGFRAGLSGDMLQITVSDNGCGIPEEELSHIFQPFVTYKENGTGLGLAIARRIIAAHGGTLEAASAPGVHTIFTVSLPI